MNVLRRCSRVLYPTLRQRWIHTALLSSGRAEVTMTPEDHLMSSIKYATSTVELLGVAARQKKDMQSSHVMQTLKTLFVLQKNGNSRLSTDEILRHPEFETLCRALRRHVRNLDLNDAIDALKVMVFLKVPTKSEIIHILLNLVRHQINDIELGQIVFLDFLLDRCDKTPIVEAFRMALPMLFQINVGSKLDHENVPQLAELLSFAVRHDCSDKSIQNIVSALTLHGENIDVEPAKSIVWSLSDLKRFHASHERLLQNSLKILIRDLHDVKFSDIEIVLTKVTQKVVNKVSVFYNEEFFEKVIDVAIERDISFHLNLFLFKKFNKISYTSDRLLDIIAKKFTEVENDSPSIIFTMVSAFSMANYTPMNWDTISQSIARSRLLRKPSNTLPWLKFALEFMSLNTYSESLLEAIFAEDFLTAFLVRSNNQLDHVQLLSLHQMLTILHPEYSGPLPSRKYLDRAIEILLSKEASPLQEPLKYAFGREFVANKVVTRHGHVLDHLVVFDAEGNPLPVADEGPESSNLEDFLGEGRKLVAVIPLTANCYSVNTSRLKGVIQTWLDTLSALGLRTLPVNLDAWALLADLEKIPYLQREIRHSAR
ncbi:uncharacterized protein LOC132265436 isoform X2 [Phlebotomus argentipes]|uniref:uncharacterized protein LOC132265436 isoform X2 n=1 Tax=Phlebotomus argentipes TaxID=94469 RepID=UPI002892B9EE|nr:uncharacterized protein LOC132265436 isoform X2 [Phlebotomus argentipes]